MSQETSVMKKTIVMLSVFVAAFSVGATPVFYWGSDGAVGDGFGPDIVDWNGNVVPKTVDWAVQILKQSDNSLVFQSGPTFWSSQDTDGVVYQAFDAATVPGLNGLAVYTRFYNNANPALATWYTVPVSPQTIAWNTAPLDATVTYEVGPVTQVMWVPEPGTGLLVLAGAAVAIFRRRRAEA
jgi:hypothetical protein